MREKRVLIAAPIGGHKQYSINLWFQWIAAQEYRNIDVCICVNGEGMEKLEEKIKQVEITTKYGDIKKIIPLILPGSDKLTTIQKITYSRERIRRYARDQKYDYLFFLDTDTIPLHMDTIQRLIDADKAVVSGLYFYKKSKVAVVIDKETRTNLSEEKIEKAYNGKKCIEVWGFGFGCTLIEMGVFEKYAFDYRIFGEERTDDFGYCHVLEQAGVPRYCLPYAICQHVARDMKDVKIGQGFRFSIMRPEE